MHSNMDELLADGLPPYQFNQRFPDIEETIKKKVSYKQPEYPTNHGFIPDSFDEQAIIRVKSRLTSKETLNNE